MSAPEPEGRPGLRYPALVGVAFAALIAIAMINALGADEPGILGVDPAVRGDPLPEFAVPELLGTLEGDANVYQDGCLSDRVPCPEGERRTQACEVDVEEAIRVCDFFDRPLAISFWFTRGGDCLATQDAFDRVARRFGDRAGFLSINVGDDRDGARELVGERGWTVPVGHDADGAVASLYRVAVCPTVAFAFTGGTFRDALIGGEDLTEARIAAEVGALIEESRRRAEAR